MLVKKQPEAPPLLRMNLLEPGVSTRPVTFANYAISPDGKAVVFVGRREDGAAPSLFVREFSKPAARMLEGTEGASMPFWSPDSRNLAFFVLPFLSGYFAWKRRIGTAIVRWLAAAFLAAALFANVYPLAPGGYTEALTALHLPIALWLAVGIAYAGGRWGEVAGRMDFIRFSGELFIYFVLIALGGGVLTAFTAMI